MSDSVITSEGSQQNPPKSTEPEDTSCVKEESDDSAVHSGDDVDDIDKSNESSQQP